MSFITRNIFNPNSNNNLQAVTDKLNGLEQANVQLGEYLKLKVRQFEEIQTKLKELESDTRLNKLADEIKLLQETSLNNKTVDLIINNKVDTVNKNVKTFSDLIETKILNKITKLEESLKEKFEEVDKLNTIVNSYKNDMKDFTSQESLEEIIKELNKRIDQCSPQLIQMEHKVQKLESTLSSYSEEKISFLSSTVVELSTSNLQLTTRIEELESRFSNLQVKQTSEESDTINLDETVNQVKVETVKKPEQPKVSNTSSKRNKRR